MCAALTLAIGAAFPTAAFAVPYAQLSSNETQMGGSAKVVTFNACDGAMRLSSLGGAVGFPEAGSYFVTAAGQIGGMGTGTVKLWLRLNGKDVDNSNAEQSVIRGTTSVLVSQGVVEVKSGDKLTLVFSTTSPDIGLIATKAGKEPCVPSMIFSAFLVSSGDYAQLSSSESQPCEPASKTVNLNQTDAAKGITNQAGTITFGQDGVYYVIAAGQVLGGGSGLVRLWFRMNGTDVDNTTTEQFLTRGETAVLISQRVARAKAGDVMTLSHSGKGTKLALAASRPRGEPVIPSMILSAFRTGTSFAQLSSLKTQLPGEAGKPLALEQNDALGGVVNENGLVTIREAGTYFAIAGGQAGGKGTGTVRLWLRQNGKDVENSNTEQSVTAGSTAVLICQSVIELEAGDTIQLMQSARGDSVGMVSTPRATAPAVPSVILSLFRID
jgi:hypothetical protein